MIKITDARGARTYVAPQHVVAMQTMHVDGILRIRLTNGDVIDTDVTAEDRIVAAIRGEAQ